MVKSLAHLFSRPPRSSVSSSLSSQTDDEDDVGARERARHSTSSHSLTSLDCTTTFYKSDDSGLHLKTYSTVSLAQPSEAVNLGVINTRNQSTKKPNIPLTHLDNWIWHEQQQASQLEEESAHAQRQSVYLTPNCKQHQMKPSKVVVSAEKSLKSVSKAFRKVFHK